MTGAELRGALGGDGEDGVMGEVGDGEAGAAAGVSTCRFFFSFLPKKNDMTVNGGVR